MPQANPDLLLHLAAKSHVDRLIEGLGEYCPTSPPDCVYIASNENGTFHHISTDEVFASLPGSFRRS